MACRCLGAWMLMSNCKPTWNVDFARGNAHAQAANKSLNTKSARTISYGV